MLVCMDGRAERYPNYPHWPGALLGIGYALIRLTGLPGDSVAYDLIQAFNNAQKYLYYHNDNHGHNCGHADKILNFSNHYGISGSEAAKFFNTIQRYSQMLDTLHGNHNEIGIAHNYNSTYTIRPKGVDTSIFVVDYTMTFNILKEIFESLKSGTNKEYYSKLSPAKIMNEMVNQLKTTAGLLTVNKMPISKLPSKVIDKPLFGLEY